LHRKWNVHSMLCARESDASSTRYERSS
jgi:hypothetical protein